MPTAADFIEKGIKADIAEKLEALQSLRPVDFPGNRGQFVACVNLHEFEGRDGGDNVLARKRGFDIRHFTTDRPSKHPGETNYERQARLKSKVVAAAESAHDPHYKDRHKNRGLRKTITLWKAADRFSRTHGVKPSDCELLGILLYTSGWYQYMNPLMRGYLDAETTPREVLAFVGHAVLWATSGIEKISSAQAARADYPRISYRVDLCNEHTNDRKDPGQVFSDTALSSSTTELSGGYTMSNDDWKAKPHCITLFRPAKGQTFRGGLDVGFRSWFGLEQSELLFRPSTPWRVVRRVKVGGSLERLINIARDSLATPAELKALRESIAKIRATRSAEILSRLRTIVLVEQAI